MSSYPRSDKLAGIAWMIVTGVLFVSVTGLVRYLGSDMHPAQAAFIRYALGLLLLAPVFVRLASGRRQRARWGLHMARGVVHATGVMLWFYAMARIPIAEVTAIGFTAPIFTTIGAALFLGESLRARRIAAVLVGFGGALIILRPGFTAIAPGAIAQLVAAPLFACSFLIAKKLTQTEASTAIVAYMSIFVTLALAPPALLAWRTPTAHEMLLLFATAALATAGHYTMVRAFKRTEITVTQPFAFLQLVWASALGYFAFAEKPDLWTMIGGAVIVASATYIAHRESRKRPLIGSREPPAKRSR